MKINHYKINYGLVLSFLAFFGIIFFLDLKPGSPQVTYTLAIAVLMATLWVTEAIPIGVTSILPFALYPFFNIMASKDVGGIYFNDTIFLYIAGFIIAFAMERWNLHKRIAIKILMFVGVKPSRIILGIMLATGLLSMWMSNTATTVMMIPIIVSLIDQLEDSLGKKKVRLFSIAVLLAVAYSATIGGVSTLIGTPPNLAFVEIYSRIFPEAKEISFNNWFFFAFPLSVIMLFSTWWFLIFVYKPGKGWEKGLSADTFREEYKKLGKITYEEIVVLTVFITLALLWITKNSLVFDKFTIKGWITLLDVEPSFIKDGTVGMVLVTLLFIFPSKAKKGERVMDWKSTHKMPWHIVLLFGGGFALASGFEVSGLAQWFAEQLQVLKGIHPFILIFIVVLLISFLTELTSNIAITNMFLPVLASMSVATNIPPLMLMIPATVAASLAFMLPVATPPNAIIFGTDRIKIADMAKTGFWINLAKVAMVTIVCYFYATIIFGIEM